MNAILVIVGIALQLVALVKVFRLIRYSKNIYFLLLALAITLLLAQSIFEHRAIEHLWQSISPLDLLDHMMKGVLALLAAYLSEHIMRLKELQNEEDMLRTTEERLRMAAEANELCVWDYDPKNNIITFETSSVFPASDAHASQCSFEDYLQHVDPMDHDRVSDLFEAMKFKNLRFRIEYRFKNQEGGSEWWYMEGKSYAAEGDRPARIIGTSRCIDSQKKKDELIQFQSDLLECIGQAIIAQNKKGEVVYWNQIAQELFGEIPEYHLPLDLSKYIPPEHRIINQPEIMRVLKSGMKWSGELNAFRMHNSPVPIYVTISPYTDHSGQFAGFIFVATDLTDYKKIQTALQESEDRLRSRMMQLQTITDNIPDQIIRIDPSHNLLFNNKTGVAANGLTQQGREQEPIADAYPLRSIPNETIASLWRDKVSRVFEGGKVEEFEYKIPDNTSQDPTYFHAIVVPEKQNLDSQGPMDDNPAAVMGIIRDITEPRRLQQSIIEMQTRLQRRIGQDLHDELGQLLTGIGFLLTGVHQDLKKEAYSSIDQFEEIRQLVEMAIAQTRILAEGLNPVTLEVYGLETSLERLALHTSKLYNLQCTFDTNNDCYGNNEPHTKELPEELAFQIYRIAQEAIHNAVKHSNASEIRVSLHCKPDGTYLSVHDNGVGFDVDHHDLKRGQGLHIMNYRSRLIGATLQITSGAENKGTLVHCAIPQSKEEKFIESYNS